MSSKKPTKKEEYGLPTTTEFEAALQGDGSKIPVVALRTTLYREKEFSLFLVLKHKKNKKLVVGLLENGLLILVLFFLLQF